MIRPTRTVTVTQRVSATRSVKHEVVIHTDVTTFDGMHAKGQLIDREHAAAFRLYCLFVTAGMAISPTLRLDTISEGVEGFDEDSGGMGADEARAAYNAILRDAGGLSATLLDNLMHGGTQGHPGWRLPTLKDALGALADQWGMD